MKNLKYILFLSIYFLFQQSIYSQWEKLSDSIHGITVLHQNNNNIYAGYLGTVYFSADNGITWIEKKSGLKYWSSVVSIDSKDSLFIIGCSGDGVYISTNYGDQWIEKDNGLVSKNVKKVGIIGRTLFAGEDYNPITNEIGGLYYSIDLGDHWKQIKNIPNINSYEFEIIDSVIFIPQSGGIYRSFDKGNNWENINDTLGSILSKDKSKLFVFHGRQYYFSEDYGNTWQKITYESDYDGFYKILVIDSLIVLCETVRNGNIFISRNFGKNWEMLNQGLSRDGGSVNSIINNDDYVFVSFYNDNIYRLKYNETVGVQDNNYSIKTDFILLQNYPNPFNPSTNIKYRIPSTNRVTLKIYDVLGREVATLVDEIKDAGSYEETFRSKTLPSGIYFYKLHVGNYIETKKMVLLK